jgi:dolichol-phosphate mannosyltransferase
MDADLSHPPEALPLLIKEIENPEIDFVIGSRYVSGAGTDASWGLFRWLNSKVATLLARPFTRAQDPMSGFFGLKKSTFCRSKRLNPIGYKIGLELIVKCECRNVREIPIFFADRKLGQSKLNIREQFNYIKHLKRLADYKYGTFSRLIQFCLVGGTGMVVDLCFYSFFLICNIPVMVARALAIWVAMTWNFGMNRRLTFSYGRHDNVLMQYLRFVSSCILGGFISWSVSMGLSKIIPSHLLVAAFLGIIAGTGLNFLFSMKWVFTGKQKSGAYAVQEVKK